MLTEAGGVAISYHHRALKYLTFVLNFMGLGGVLRKPATWWQAADINIRMVCLSYVLVLHRNIRPSSAIQYNDKISTTGQCSLYNFVGSQVIYVSSLRGNFPTIDGSARRRRYNWPENCVRMA